MFAIGWLELGEAEKSQRLLEKCFENIQGPFQVSLCLTCPPALIICSVDVSLPPLAGLEWIIRWLWSCELSHRHGRISASCAVWLHRFQVFSQPSLHAQCKKGSNTYSSELVCSCLQSLFLLLLFRVQKGCLAFSPLLPDDICELCVRGVNYLGSQMDWLLRKEEVCIIVREKGRCAQNIKSYKLEVVLKASGVKIPLTPGISLVAFIHSDVCVVC